MRVQYENLQREMRALFNDPNAHKPKIYALTPDTALDIIRRGRRALNPRTCPRHSRDCILRAIAVLRRLPAKNFDTLSKTGMSGLRVTDENFKEHWYVYSGDLEKYQGLEISRKMRAMIYLRRELQEADERISDAAKRWPRGGGYARGGYAADNSSFCYPEVTAFYTRHAFSISILGFIPLKDRLKIFKESK